MEEWRMMGMNDQSRNRKTTCFKRRKTKGCEKRSINGTRRSANKEIKLKRRET